jgi:hypothetical protein
MNQVFRKYGAVAIGEWPNSEIEKVLDVVKAEGEFGFYRLQSFERLISHTVYR